jgi:hypothetical protein
MIPPMMKSVESLSDWIYVSNNVGISSDLRPI